MSLTTQPLPGTVIDPLYPDEDGRPMGDTQYHTWAVALLREALEDVFTTTLDVFVAAYLIYYYELGDPTARRDPDVLVAKGVVGKHPRRSFRLWEEGVRPCTLFEIASRKTWRQDVGEKRELYARLRVPEYILFDPEGRYLDPVLQGFRSRRGVSVPMKPNADGSLTSRQLGLRLMPEGAMLRLIDLRTGQPVLTRSEWAERAEQEKQRAEQLAAEVERLRAEVARLSRPGSAP